jgi:hypothetical protein
MILRAKTQERRTCVNNLRNWFHQKGTKPPLHDLLEALEQTTN